MTNIHPLFFNGASRLAEFAPTLTLIQFSYAFFLFTMACQWLGQKGLINKSTANAMRLFNTLISVPVLTLVMSNYVLQYIGRFLNAPVLYVCVHSLGLAGLVVVAVWLYKNSAQPVLVNLILTLPLYGFFILVDYNYWPITPVLLIHVTFYAYVMALVHFSGISPYDGLHDLSQRFRARFKSYDNLVLALQDYDDKQHLVQNLTCGLTLSLLNFTQVYENAGTLGAKVTLVIIGFSVALNTLLACEFIHTARNVPYHYNFIIQTYMNLYKSLQRIWSQTQKGVLGGVSVTHASMVLILALVNTPSAYAMDEASGSAGLGHKRISAGDSSMGLGDPAAPTGHDQQGEPVGEGQVSKAAKIAIDSGKTAFDYAKPHLVEAAKEARDRVVDTVKGQAAGAAVGLTTAAVLGGLGMSSDPTPEQLKSTLADTAVELDKTKTALEEEEAKSKLLTAAKETKEKDLIAEQSRNKQLQARIDALEKEAASTSANIEKINQAGTKSPDK